MKTTNNPQAFVHMILPDAAIVQAELTDVPAALTLETPSGAMRVEIKPGFCGDKRLLTKARQGV